MPLNCTPNIHNSVVSLSIQKTQMSKEVNLKEKWDFLIKNLSEQFADGDTLNVDAVIYLIGVQELGQGQRPFKKDEKVNLMHIAICKLLEPYGYYEFDFFDPDGWPHYKTITELPSLKPGEQAVLIKEAIIHYFELVDFFK
ncbi:conserved hypothetical protein [Tenacibaculum finnmarkense]|uniref:Uncharacterized protein n=2 Tax=Tenacibaculum finnmarkense TaxID=2781243 RepID=A0A2I2M947_9FLAO|nr:conserved hypothetical protein [Tenacibaculum finnmarkense]SOS54608.1 conserved hypothetical protein [Tenacibaculum finnmarkense]SOU89073.1 conserved hypothetical protein [Tenacibaculum finnmarkense genomovar ulcerans]